MFLITATYKVIKMAKLITLEVTRTYATRENAAKAFEKKFGGTDLRDRC